MRKRTLIELLLIIPLLFIGMLVWQRGINRNPGTHQPVENEDPTPHRVQDLIRRTPASPPAATAQAAPQPTAAPVAAPQPALITVQVLEADGTIPTDAVLVFSPDDTLYESAPLGQLVLSADPGPLTLQASATDGATLRLSDTYHLTLESGERHTLQIRLPRPEILLGAPGFALIPGDGYALVAEILPDSPAHHAGLQIGDAVLAIDGIPCQDLTQDQLDTLLIGPATQPLRLNLVLQHETGEFEETEALINRLPLP